MKNIDAHLLGIYQKAAPGTAKLLAGLKAFFDIGTDAAAPYYCRLAAMRKEAKLDTIALDDLLHERHGDYEDEGLSMRDLVAREYGDEAVTFIKVSM